MRNEFPNPPSKAKKLITWFLNGNLLEEVLGDLEEQFESKIKKNSISKAKLNYWWQVFNYLRPFAIKSILKNSNSMNNYFDIFRHNLLIFLRTIKKHKSTFFINLTGLTLGLSCIIFINLWVSDEFSYNKFLEGSEKIHQAMYHHEESGTLNTLGHTQALLADALKNEVPEIDLAVTDTDPEWFGNNFSISNGDIFYKSKGKFSGKDYFKVFSFNLIEGNKEKALTNLGNIVISEEIAFKLFKSKDVLGKTVKWQLLDIEQSAIISGVFENIPQNSTEQFDFIIPFEGFANIIGEESIHWGNYNALTYVTFKPKTKLSVFNKRISSFAKEHREDLNVNLFFRPFTNKYLFNNYANGIQSGGRIIYLYLFSIIGLFIIIIGCINFMNLATARSSWRMKETGLKKSLGATRKTLIAQHLTESVLTVLLAMICAHIIAVFLMPQFNALTDKQLSLNYSFEYTFKVLGLVIGVGLIAGSYPAWYLSSFKAILALKGLLDKNSNSLIQVLTRKGLVIFQFTISIVLIISVIIIYKQVEFVQNKNLGYDRENLLILPKEGKANENLDLFLTNLTDIPGVNNASASANNFTSNGNYTTGVKWNGKDPDVAIRFTNASVYYGLIETLGIEILEGRSFDKTFSNEVEKLILNETAVKTMGLKNPVGEIVTLWGTKKEIIGVAKDFHFKSLHEKVSPLFFKLDPDFLTHILLRIDSGKEKETLAYLDTFYKEFNPGFILRYQFMDLSYQSLYEAENRVSIIARYFAGFAIFISCMGLFGLAAFTAEKRMKEIGVRKILGASELGIIFLLSADFTKMVLFAILLGIPTSYFLVQNWLENFAYNISLEWWYFILTGFTALIIAWLTIGIQTFHAANRNPTECLRSE